ncbi:MAG: hypothetical protein KDD44_13755, partial [Bdellovibrionales bacterium]|nr:hypothetical protein [Bdellovibrionales bacterium]
LRQQTTAVQAEIDVVVAQLNYIDGQVQAGTPASIELQSELQKLRTLLRNPYSLRRELSVRREENRRVTGLRIRLEKERDELTDLNAAVGQELAQFSELSEDERVPVEAELAELFKTRREYLDGFLAESRAYLTVVREYSRLLESLLSTGDQARSFLGARGLLMQSAELPQVKDVQTVKEGLHWLSNVENLRPNLEAMLQSLRTHPYVAGVLLIFVLLLLPARLMLERRWGVDERHRIAFSPWALVHILFLSGLVLWVLVSNWSVLEIAVADHPVWVTVASVITLGFLILRSTVSPVVLPSLSPNQKSETMAEKLKRAHTFRPTLWAIFHTIVLSSYSAWVLWALGYMLLLDQSAPEYSLSVGFGLERAAAVFLLLNVIRQLCRVDGLADEHFEWPERTVLHIRKHLNWFILLGTIL